MNKAELKLTLLPHSQQLLETRGYAISVSGTFSYDSRSVIVPSFHP